MIDDLDAVPHRMRNGHAARLGVERAVLEVAIEAI
jgi:hypothetical protein